MTLLDDAWAVWMEERGADGKLSQGENWRNDNPGQWERLKAYREGGERPDDLAGNTGREHVLLTDAWYAEQGGTIPPEPPTTGVAPPKEPIERINNAPTLGINCTTKRDIHDVIIDGTGETGVLFQGVVNNCKADGSTIRRVKMSRVAEGDAVDYGMHGIYGKATGLVCEDIEMHLSDNCANGISARFPSVWKRFLIRGGQAHAIGIFETGDVVGEYLFEDIDGTYRNSGAAIWCDAETGYRSTVIGNFVMRRVHLSGPAGAKFFSTYANVFKGSLLCEGCTLNGKPVTAAMVNGVSNLTIR